MSSRQIQILILVILIVLTGAIGALALATTAPANSASPGALYQGLTRRVTSDGASILGDPAAPITLVEFTDFSCAHCAAYRQTIHEFVTRYVRTGKARYELRILAGLDPAGSPVAARTALCAGEQSAFWEMVDELFQLQVLYGRTAFTTEHINDTANQVLNLNTSDLTSCMNTSRYQEGIQHSIDLAASLGVNSLPAILIRKGSGLPEWIEWQGQVLTGQVSYETLSQALDQALAGLVNLGLSSAP